MKVNLFPFQANAMYKLRKTTAEAIESYQRTRVPQVISFTAPTGAGKTIILASLVESIFDGVENYEDQPNAIFVWLSDSPELNEQSRSKFESKADKIRSDQYVTITDDSFDQELLDDGHVYFLNTQKLGKSSNLTKKSDERTFTIWETLQNTIYEKYDHLYFIIDEAHRGMQGREAARATTIMQKFLKGSTEDCMPPAPVVIGATATPERFNNLVSGISSTIYPVVVSPGSVRASGLLKDRIIIAYPDETSSGKEMAVLQAAVDDWKQKCDHWYQYCKEQHYTRVNPVFVVQVQNQTGRSISDTNLDDCLREIENRSGFNFRVGEVVHTFGQTTSNIIINDLSVGYLEPSRIADDKNVRVVFFKENLSTGWDCPRAETMMSFRRASDATYIAQLLGRMVRTPLQMRIRVDDILNDVHLFLPYFDAQTVEDVVQALQSTEGGEIPTDVIGDPINHNTVETWTIHPPRNNSTPQSNEVSSQIQDQHFQDNSSLLDDEISSDATEPTSNTSNTSNNRDYSLSNNPPRVSIPDSSDTLFNNVNTNNVPATEVSTELEQTDALPTVKPIANIAVENKLDRVAIVKAINDAGLLTYEVRTIRINDYLKSLFSLARLLTQSGLSLSARSDVVDEVVDMIHNFIEKKKDSGEYESLVNQVLQFRLKTKTFDVFGKSVDEAAEMDLFSTSDTDLDRQFRRAENKLGNEGVGNQYGRRYLDEDNPMAYKIDVVIFATDEECIKELHTYAEKQFHKLNDSYRRKISSLSDQNQKKYDDIVSNGDVISKHNFKLPETIRINRTDDGKQYSDHLFVDNSTGVAIIKLNNWEEAVLQAERSRSDFVSWVRNPPRNSWSLCIPYKQNSETKSMYPDFLIIRKDEAGYVVDILEPHDGTRTDNLGKAKGLAEYARQNPGVGRIQLIRLVNGKIKRLDMSRGAVRDRVSFAMSNDELDHIFDEDGFFD